MQGEYVRPRVSRWVRLTNHDGTEHFPTPPQAPSGRRLRRPQHRARGVLRVRRERSAAIDRDDYDVVPIGISREGRWVLAADEPDRLAITGGKLPEVDDAGASRRARRRPDASAASRSTSPGRCRSELGEVDVVLPLLHGPYGEDGTLQGLLELAGVPYVGSGVFASAAAMDKGHMKALLAAAGLPVGPYAVVTRTAVGRRDKAAVRESVAALGLPVFVKPARAGSQRRHHQGARARRAGRRRSRRRASTTRASSSRPRSGREIECGVLEGLDGAAPEASVPARSSSAASHEFYDFAAKYLPDEGTELAVPADLPDDGGRPRSATWRAGRSKRSSARAWRESTSSSGRKGVSSSTRSTRCPGSRRSRCSR